MIAAPPRPATDRPYRRVPDRPRQGHAHDGLPSPAEPPSGAAARLRALDPTADAERTVDSEISGPRLARMYRDRLRFTDTAIIVVAVLVAIAIGYPLVDDSVITADSGLDRVGIPVMVAATWLAALAAFRTRDCHVVGVGVLEYRRVLTPRRPHSDRSPLSSCSFRSRTRGRTSSWLHRSGSAACSSVDGCGASG